ncbi:DUF6660 family protein [Aestuariivivens insulae]|uniref:DUF6660 family protein n=1 Tax=Aestuariivivens insulae TaxID=1621988 RepID=UPI001F5892B1|nr:DUF6660 family protein [Aestuariivivens insulae]
MKILTTILAIYIFALNIVPCEDGVAISDEVKTELSQAIDHDHQHQDADLCSPFCQCHCCHIHVTHFNEVEYTLSNPLISCEVFFHTEGLVKAFNNSVLQPPQV